MLSGKVIQENILRYCRAMQGSGPGRYKYSIDCPETMWGSSFAALTLGLIGHIEVAFDETINFDLAGSLYGDILNYLAQILTLSKVVLGHERNLENNGTSYC